MTNAECFFKLPVVAWIPWDEHITKTYSFLHHYMIHYTTLLIH